MSLIVALLVPLVILGLVVWAIGQFPIDPMILKIIRVGAIVLAVLFVLQAFGLIPGWHLVR